MNLIMLLPEKVRVCKCLKPSNEEKLFIHGFKKYKQRIDLVTFLKQWDIVKRNMKKMLRK